MMDPTWPRTSPELRAHIEWWRGILADLIPRLSDRDLAKLRYRLAKDPPARDPLGTTIHLLCQEMIRMELELRTIVKYAVVTR